MIDLATGSQQSRFSVRQRTIITLSRQRNDMLLLWRILPYDLKTAQQLFTFSCKGVF